MLGHAAARQPAPMLAMRPIGLRLRHGVDALGNAIGESIAAESQPKRDWLAGSGLKLGNVSSGPRLGMPLSDTVGGTSDFANDVFDRTYAARANEPSWLSDYRDRQLRAGVDPALINSLAPGDSPASVAEAAKRLTSQTLQKAAGTGVEAAAQAGSKVGPFVEAVAPWLGRLSAGAGLLFYMKDGPTTDWQAGGSKFSYNRDDFTLNVTDNTTDVRVAVSGIQNPSRYSDAQYLAYVSYKANGGALAIDDFAAFDPPTLGPVDRASSQKPEWLKRLDAGNAFNAQRAGAYPYNEVYVNKPSGGGYFRLDSYNDRTEEIVSRKFTQFSEITEQTAIGYVKEMVAKYPAGTTIANVPTNVQNGLAGQTLRGVQILEVPVQIKPIPQAVLDAAYRSDVIIRDIKGKTH